MKRNFKYNSPLNKIIFIEKVLDILYLFVFYTISINFILRIEISFRKRSEWPEKTLIDKEQITGH
jgi:hypothetical protein